MEAVMEYVDCVNFHWIVIVTTGMYMHLRQICIIGLCFENDINSSFDSSYASIIFIFAVLCLLAEYKLWPSSLKEPPIQLLYIYEILVTALVTNLATRCIWIPMMEGIWCMTQESRKWVVWINSMMGFDNYSILMDFASYIGTKDASVHTAFCMAVLSFVWMLDATESLDAVLDKFSMAKLLCTIWALVLNTLGIWIFRFSNSIEDEECEISMTEPSSIAPFFFASGVYTIIQSFSLFPSTFRKPNAFILCIYEFLASAFLLENSIECIWIPIDDLIQKVLPVAICNTLLQFEFKEAADFVTDIKDLTAIISYLLAFLFFILSLDVTRSVNFTLFTERGTMVFLKCTKDRLWQRIISELPEMNSEENCQRKIRKKKKKRTHSSSS